MRNWWTTVGAVALCATMTPQAWAATSHARGHTSQSSLRGHQTDDDSKPAKGKKTPAKKTTAKKDEAEELDCSAKAKRNKARARACAKEEAADKTPAKGKRGASHEEPAETVVASGSLPDARGKVSEIAPPPEKIGKGDTLYAVARRTGVPAEELAELNKLKKPYHVRLGQTLKLPKTRAYTVHSGDTLSGVAARFGLDTDVLAAFNSFSAKTPIRAGQKIDLPPNAEDKAAKARAKPEREKPTPPPAKPKPAPTHAAPPPPVREPAPQYTPPPAVAEQPPAPETRPETQTPPPASSTPAYRPPAQSGAYPGATALPPVRTPPAQTTTPQTQAAPPPVARPQPQPSRPPIQQERPQANPPQPESDSGFQMIPAPQPQSQQPNARPTYGARPTPQYTPPPAQTYRPPAQSGRPIIQTSPAPSQGQVAAAGRGRFIWPVRGNVLSPFGLKANGQRNDGLNIQVQTGEPVRAASAGEVVYAGDQVPSYGNLVLIKHAGGWVTAYANLGRITVSNRDQVTQGQQIGVAGMSGSVDQPQLHFEVRYAASAQDKALPVDPALVLPER